MKATKTFCHCLPLLNSQGYHLEKPLVETVPTPLLGNESRWLEVDEEIEGNRIFLTAED